MKLFISPHNDDETLFGAFTLLREKPQVLIVYDSHTQLLRGDTITAEQRRQESRAAANILGVDVSFGGVSDTSSDYAECVAALQPFIAAKHVWAPAFEPDGNAQHNLIANAVTSLFPAARRYMTYTRFGKSRGKLVPIAPGWTQKKLHALACYETQLDLEATRSFFLRDLYEYYLL